MKKTLLLVSICILVFNILGMIATINATYFLLFSMFSALNITSILIITMIPED